MKLYQQWAGLKSSEQNLLTLGFTFIVIALVYFYIWVPYQNTIDGYKKNIAYINQDIQWFKQFTANIDQLKNRSNQRSGSFTGSLIQAVDKSIKEQRLNEFVELLEVSGKDNVVIQFKATQFDDLIKWVIYLKTRYGIVVKTIAAQKIDANGLANAQFILKEISR